MAGLNEEARIPVYINDEQAKSALKTLQNEADKWKRKMYEAMEVGDLKGMKEAERELKKVTKQTAELKREAFDVNKVLSNLSSASAKDLKKAVQSLNREMDGLNRNTKEYTDKKAQLQQLRTELYGVNSAIREQRGLLSRTADFVNRYWSIISGAALSLVGIKATIDQATQSFAKHDDQLADVMKTTQMTKEDVKELNKEFQNIDTRTSREGLNKIAEEGGRIGIVKDEILDFVKAMDIANVALGDSFKGGPEEIANTLGKLKFLFEDTKKMGVEKAYLAIGSAINELGADGVASEANIAEFATRIGSLPASLKPSVSLALGLGAAFEESGIQAEIASRAYSIVLNRASTETGKFAQVMGKSKKEVEDMINANPVNFFLEFSEALKGMNATETSRTLDQLQINADGANKVIGAAANNTDRFRQMLDLSNKSFTEANSVINEFNTKNNTAQARLDKSKKKLEDMRIELGEKLAPVMTFSTNSSTYFLKALSAIFSIFSKYGSTIITVSSSIAAYTIATKLAVLWKERENKATLANIVAGKLQAIAYRAQFAAISLYNAVVALLRGNLAVATIQFRAFSAALMANPIGLITGLVVALGFALYSLSGRLTTAQKVQKALNDVSVDAQKNIVEERLKMEQLVKTARNDKLTKETRLKAIKDLNELSPKYLGNLTLEKINTDEAKKATDLYTESLLKNAKAQAAKEKLVEIEKQLIDLQNGEGADPSFWQKTWNGILSGGNAVSYAFRNANTVLDNISEKEKELIETRKRLTETYMNENSTPQPAGGGGTEPAVGTRKTVGNIVYEWDGKNWNEVATVGNLDDASKALEIANKQRILELQKSYADEENMQKFLHARLLANEIAYLQAKAALETDEVKKLDLQTQIVLKQVEYNKAVKDAVEPLKLKKKAVEEINTKLLEEAKITQRNAEIAATAATEQEALNKKLEAQAQSYVDTINVISNGLYDMMSGSEDAFKTFAKNILIFALEQLKVQAQIAAAGATIQSITQPDSITTFGASGLARAAVIIGLIEAAFATVEGLVNNAFTSRKNVKSMDEGGFAGYTGAGSKYEKKQLVQLHGEEYVVPLEGTQNPTVKPVIDAIEIARRNGSLARLDLSQIMAAIPARQMYHGGFSSPPAGQISPPNSFKEGAGGGSHTDTEIKQLMHMILQMTKEIRENPPRLPIDQFERERKKYIDIQQTKGL